MSLSISSLEKPPPGLLVGPWGGAESESAIASRKALVEDTILGVGNGKGASGDVSVPDFFSCDVIRLMESLKKSSVVFDCFFEIGFGVDLDFPAVVNSS